MEKMFQLKRSMPMAYNTIFTPNFTSLFSTNPNKHLISFQNHLPSAPLQYFNNRKDFPLPAAASISYQPINVDYLETEFSGQGVSFAAIGDSCIVKMGLDSGSMASLMLPSGLITSYKTPMWHGGKVEVLHTSVSEGKDGDAIIQGGVSLAFNYLGDDGVLWSPSTWALSNVRRNLQESVQVELVSCDSKDKVELKYIVTLQQDTLSSELVISNSKSTSLHMMGSIISHLTVSTPEATYAIGLEGSNFINKPPFLSKFGIIPPDYGQTKGFFSGQVWDQMQLARFMPGWGASNQNNAEGLEIRQREGEREEMEGEEANNYKHLTEEMSTIYTSAPRNFTIIDRGRRNSVVIRRDEFNELYMFSPGSSHEFYSKYSYVCVGQSAMLKPIILSPEHTWKGGQHIHNPNL